MFSATVHFYCFFQNLFQKKSDDDMEAIDLLETQPSGIPFDPEDRHRLTIQCTHSVFKFINISLFSSATWLPLAILSHIIFNCNLFTISVS